MKNRIYIILEFFAALGFGFLGLWIFDKFYISTLNASIFFGFIVMMCSAVFGVTVVGYFHFKANNKLKDLAKAIMRSLIMLVLFTLVYLLFLQILPSSPEFLILIIPLIGAVVGFNSSSKKLGIPI